MGLFLKFFFRPSSAGAGREEPSGSVQLLNRVQVLAADTLRPHFSFIYAISPILLYNEG